jgi:hypothetical protein
MVARLSLIPSEIFPYFDHALISAPDLYQPTLNGMASV